MRLLPIYILITIYSNAVGQGSATRNWVDSEATYKDSVGHVVTVYNSLPKGGGRYMDSTGRNYSYVVFWNRVINKSEKALELSIKFPVEPLRIFPSPDSYVRIFLPPDTMTLDKVPLFDYGFTNLQSFLENGFNKPSVLQRTINPKEEFLFYIPILFYEERGSTRTALVLKGQDIFYKISVAPGVDSVLIPCGQLVFKN